MEKMLISSLQDFVAIIVQAFWKKTLILIDEYDVPLDKAFSEWLLQRDGVIDQRSFRNGVEDQ